MNTSMVNGTSKYSDQHNICSGRGKKNLHLYHLHSSNNILMSENLRYHDNIALFKGGIVFLNILRYIGYRC